MIEIWDYLMRRKGLLLAILAAFLVSSILSYQAFRGNAAKKPMEYISIKDWGNTDVEVPRTGALQSVISVMSPRDLVNILALDNSTENSENPLNPASEELLADNPGEHPDNALETSESESDTLEPESDIEANGEALLEDESGKEPIEGPADEPGNDETAHVIESAEAIENTVLPATGNTVEHDTATESSRNQSYLVFLIVIGIVTAASLVYFSEQHFLR